MSLLSNADVQPASSTHDASYLKNILSVRCLLCLQALCNSGGLCDPVLARYKMGPGRWWLCYSENSQMEMVNRISEMLKHAVPEDELSEITDEESVSNGNSGGDGEKCTPYLQYWVELRERLEVLKDTHYKTLQRMCYSFGKCNAYFSYVSFVLGISGDDWEDCYAAGDGCRVKMVHSITDMINNAMKDISMETFTSVKEPPSADIEESAPSDPKKEIVSEVSVVREVTIDLSPLSGAKSLCEGFLQGHTELTKIVLTPLSKVEMLPKRFLRGCSGLKSIDMSPLVAVKELPADLFTGCPGLTEMVPPPNVNTPPQGWAVVFPTCWQRVAQY